MGQGLFLVACALPCCVCAPSMAAFWAGEDDKQAHGEVGVHGGPGLSHQAPTCLVVWHACTTARQKMHERNHVCMCVGGWVGAWMCN